MNTKTFRFGSIKAGAKAGLKEGQMEAYASIFDNVDSYGDVVVKGAFEATLKEWKSGDRVMPLLYGHNMSDPNMNIGSILSAEEDDRGLKIVAQFDDDEMAQKVYRLVKGGRISELSFAFDTVKSALIQDKDRPDAWRELQEVKLYECSVVPIGANSETEVLNIKGLDGIVTQAKAGRTLSKANESSLRSAREELSKAIDELDKVLPPEPDADAPDDNDVDKDTDAVKSGGSDASGKSSDTPPTFGEQDLKSLAEMFTDTVMSVLQEQGVIPPPIKSAGVVPDPLVEEIEVLGLLQDLQ